MNKKQQQIRKRKIANKLKTVQTKLLAMNLPIKYDQGGFAKTVHIMKLGFEFAFRCGWIKENV